MVTGASDLSARATPATPVARTGQFVTRALLFLILVGALLAAAETYSLPFWVTVLVGAALVGPMLYWPTLGMTVVLAYLAVAGVRALI